LNRDSLGVAFKCCAMYVGGKEFPVGKDPIAGGKKSYGGNPPVIRGSDGVLRNRGEYDADGNMLKAQPMSYDEFVKGAAGDALELVFEDGEIKKDQLFDDIKKNAKITKLQDALKEAVDKLEKKVDFFQRFSSDESVAIRLAEASVGSKWGHSHATKLAELEQKHPKYSEAFKKLGFTPQMDSTALLNHIKQNHVCDKKAKKKVLNAVTEDDCETADKAMTGKVVLTL